VTRGPYRAGSMIAESEGWQSTEGLLARIQLRHKQERLAESARKRCANIARIVLD